MLRDWHGQGKNDPRSTGRRDARDWIVRLTAGTSLSRQGSRPFPRLARAVIGTCRRHSPAKEFWQLLQGVNGSSPTAAPVALVKAAPVRQPTCVPCRRRLALSLLTVTLPRCHHAGSRSDFAASSGRAGDDHHCRQCRRCSSTPTIPLPSISSVADAHSEPRADAEAEFSP